MKSGSNLERVLESGAFAVTAECGPPKGNDVSVLRKKAEFLKGRVDAANVTDNQTAVVRMSSIAASALLLQLGIEPVMQMVCRDRNRIAMQSDLFGASALGLRNLLCLSGDHVCFGSQPGAKKVFDIDSTQLVSMARRLRDEKKTLGSEEPTQGNLPVFIGAGANPFAKPLEFRALLLKKKVEAGADFVQTQGVFDLELFRNWMKGVRDLGLHTRCRIMAGVIPLKSLGMTRYMAQNVPGVAIPEEILKRMAGVPKEKASEEGIRICLETIQALREIEGVSGIHIMAIEWEQKVPEIVERAGLLPRPLPD
jgi:methylenetetrahydrofolate reductase (NADPH)